MNSTDRSIINKGKEELEKKSLYPRINLQSGNKDKQIFYIKLLPRLIPPSEICKTPWFHYIKHFSCGPAHDQSFICLNKTIAEKKTNAKKCPQCIECRKILFNKSEFNENIIKRAQTMSAKGQFNWPIYDLEKRKQVEMLERNDFILDELLDKFGTDANPIDLTDLMESFTKNKTPSAIKITRRGIGQFGSKYSYDVVYGAEYALTKEDLIKIKKTYIVPETLDGVITLQEIVDIMTTGVEVDENEIVDSKITETIPVSQSSDTDITDTEAAAILGTRDPNTAGQARQREREKPAEATEPKKVSTIPASDNIDDEINAILNG